MGVGTPLSPGPVNNIAGSGMGEPICKPVLRRPVGWRELDSNTLLSRAYGLIAAQCEPVCWLDDRARHVQDASNKPSAVPVSNGKRQLPSSDNFIFEELSRIDVLKEHQKRDQFAAQESRAPKKGRYSGWVLTASLVLVALQFALFLVAVNPREVIENFKLSVRQWQINLPETGSVTSHGQPPTQDKAAWWKAWQQTFVPDMFSSHHEAPSSGSQTKPHSTEAVK